MLRAFLPARGTPYGRVSVRESLRVFERVTDSLSAACPGAAAAAAPPPAKDGAQPSRSNTGAAGPPDDSAFERLCALSGVPGTEHLNNWVSCGNTQEAFAALFIDPNTLDPGVHSLLHGSDAWQLASNRNIVLFTWRFHVTTKLWAWLGYAPFTAADRNEFSCYAQSVGSSSSKRFLTKLEHSLLTEDAPQHLPRVFFCSLTWLTPGFSATLAELDDDDEDDASTEKAYWGQSCSKKLAEVDADGFVGVQVCFYI